MPHIAENASIADFPDRLVSQYRDSPRFRAWISELVAALERISHAPLDVRERNLDVDLAAGFGLDRIGDALGVPRPVIASTTGQFGFEGAGGAVGYDQGRLASSLAGLEARTPMGDVRYRDRVRLGGRTLTSPHTLADMREMIRAVYPETLVVDGGDHRVGVSMLPDDAPALNDLPHPATVSMRPLVNATHATMATYDIAAATPAPKDISYSRHDGKLYVANASPAYIHAFDTDGTEDVASGFASAPNPDPHGIVAWDNDIYFHTDYAGAGTTIYQTGGVGGSDLINDVLSAHGMFAFPYSSFPTAFVFDVADRAFRYVRRDAASDWYSGYKRFIDTAANPTANGVAYRSLNSLIYVGYTAGQVLRAYSVTGTRMASMDITLPSDVAAIVAFDFTPDDEIWLINSPGANKYELKCISGGMVIG